MTDPPVVRYCSTITATCRSDAYQLADRRCRSEAGQLTTSQRVAATRFSARQRPGLSTVRIRHWRDGTFLRSARTSPLEGLLPIRYICSLTWDPRSRMLDARVQPWLSGMSSAGSADCVPSWLQARWACLLAPLGSSPDPCDLRSALSDAPRRCHTRSVQSPTRSAVLPNVLETDRRVRRNAPASGADFSKQFGADPGPER